MYLIIFESVVTQASNGRGFILQTRTRLPRGHKQLNQRPHVHRVT